MSTPKILRHMDSKDSPHESMGWVSTDEEETPGPTIPVNADTLGGYPPEHFATITDVAEAINSYITTILSKSY